MAHEILSVKLCELDEKIGRLHSRVYFSESAKHNQLKGEIEELKKEYAEAELILRNRLQFSRASVITALSKAYGEIEQIIQKMKEEYQVQVSDGNEEFSAEEKALLAEYALDFAMQAADRALLLSMEAIDAQMTQQEKEERSLS